MRRDPRGVGVSYERGDPAGARPPLIPYRATSLIRNTPWLNHRRPFVGLSQPRSAPFLEPFCEKLLSKVDKSCWKLTFEIPPRRALRGRVDLDVVEGRRRHDGRRDHLRKACV